MSHVLRLTPPIYLETTRGPGYAHFMHTNGIEGDTTWTVFIDSGEYATQIWEAPNHQVRACRNYTAGRDLEPNWENGGIHGNAD